MRDDTANLEEKLLDIEMQFIEMEDGALRQFGFWLDDAGKDMNKIVGDV